MPSKITNPIQSAHRLGQAVWIDYIRRGLLTSGEFQRFIDLGISGVTSNPTIFEKAIVGSTDYDEVLIPLIRSEKSTTEIYEALALADIRAAADLLRPVYDETNGTHGYASLEVSPSLAYRTDDTIAEARRLFAALDRPNVMIKVPATPEGIPAIRHLIGEGINVNVTLIFSLDSHRQVMAAYITGLEELAEAGGEVSRVASVASFFLSRVDTVVDIRLEEHIQTGQESLKALSGKTAIASAKLAYQSFQDTFRSERFAALRAKGARVQRPLWASTGTKNPTYPDLLYVEPLIGADTVNTMPPATITAFLDHGRVAPTLEQGVAEAESTLQALADAGISLEQVTTQLLSDGVKSFAGSFDTLLTNIEEKRSRLLAKEHVHPGINLGAHQVDVETAITDLQQRDVIGRIWQKDHTVWKSDPTEITNRLGWLTITDIMGEQVPALRTFAEEVRDAGFRNVVLLGMGGSSLGPEVLRQVLARDASYPALIVLDSTVPACVQAVRKAIDPARTLFLVSSKSGGTIEPLSFYQYFRGQVETAIGREMAGQNFVAITDPGTSLVSLAQEHGFRRIFLNPTDIGGRYSVLSYFGLVPAALTGIDIAALLDRADRMREGCASCVPPHENPGAWLGATMGTIARSGRDKLTLVTSPAIASFGLWVEQLIAESTGKEGKGIIPIASEPPLEPADYPADRLFIYLRLKDDDNTATDAAIEGLKSGGQPVLRLELQDRYDLGSEFFRWEFATAVAGAILGINPFDQPNVQAAKDRTDQVLQEYIAAGHLPPAAPTLSLDELLAEDKTGKYLAIMAYLFMTPETDQALTSLRRRITEKYHIATTLGYGPRFLHSTGQLHKGGPGSGLFLQITVDHKEDLAIPGKPYTFGVLADAQALGDLQALKAAGRPLTRIHLSSSNGAAIDKLASGLL